MKQYDLFLSRTQNPNRIIVFTLRSMGRRAAIIQKLFHKWLFEELNREERMIFLLHHETILEPQIFASLKAYKNFVSKKVIRVVLRDYSYLFKNSKIPTNERHIGYRTLRFSYEKHEKYYNPKKGIKYSGWKRHHTDHGSLAPDFIQEPFYSDSIDEDDNIDLFLEICQRINPEKPESLYNQRRLHQ